MNERYAMRRGGWITYGQAARHFCGVQEERFRFAPGVLPSSRGLHPALGWLALVVVVLVAFTASGCA